MAYKVKALDTDKALNFIEDVKKEMKEERRVEEEKTKAYYKGIEKGLDIVKDIFSNANLEKREENE